MWSKKDVVSCQYCIGGLIDFHICSRSGLKHVPYYSLDLPKINSAIKILDYCLFYYLGFLMVFQKMFIYDSLSVAQDLVQLAAQIQLQLSQVEFQLVEEGTRMAPGSTMACPLNTDDTAVPVEHESTSNEPQAIHSEHELNSTEHVITALAQESTSNTQKVFIVAVEEESASQEPEMIPVEEESTVNEPEIISVEEESAGDAPEMIPVEEESAGNEPEIIPVEEESADNVPEMIPVEEESASNQPEVILAEEESANDEPEILPVEETSAINESEIIPVEEESASNEPEIIPMEQESPCNEPEVISVGQQSTSNESGFAGKGTEQGETVTYEVLHQGTRRGRAKLIDSNGYTYNKKFESPKVIYWQCTVRSKVKHCKSTVIQRGDVFQMGLHGHNHEPKVAAMATGRIAALVKEKAQTNLLKPAPAIVNEVCCFALLFYFIIVLYYISIYQISG